jgi:hypothetical protein
MKIWRAGLETKPATNLFNSPKPAQEQKDIANPHALFVEMALGGIRLSEQWPPARLAW